MMQNKALDLTTKQNKQVKKWKENASSILRKAISEKIEQRKSRAMVEHNPQYDEVYFSGLATLNSGIEIIQLLELTKKNADF